MTAQDPARFLTGQLQAAAKKVFSPASDDAPSPEFVNHVEFSAVGMDLFMDVGTVSPESIRDAMLSGDKPPSVRFNVSSRFGMSLQTAAVMLQGLATLVQAAAAQGPPQVSPQAPPGGIAHTAMHVEEDASTKGA